jgi:hypothetical protein
VLPRLSSSPRALSSLCCLGSPAAPARGCVPGRPAPPTPSSNRCRLTERVTTFSRQPSAASWKKSVSRTRAVVSVTEPPKIIPYYRLSRSTWPLSNNKELLSRFRRVKPDKSHTTGSLICAKPTRRRDQSTTLHYMKGSQVQDYYKPVFRT